MTESKNLISEAFPVLCGSKGCGEVRPNNEESHSTRSQLRGIGLGESLRMHNNRHRKFDSCPLALRA